jgi:hypothetical protein
MFSVTGIMGKYLFAGIRSFEMMQQHLDTPFHQYRSDWPHRIAAVLFLVLLGSISFKSSAESRIELIDGTSINGEVVSMSNGRYVIRSQSLGQIEVPSSSIRSIKPTGATTPSGQANTDIQAIQQQIGTSPELMQMVTSMMSDPEIQEVIKDPELVQLIMSGNLEVLKNDPRIHQLMNNPSMQAVIRKMQGGKDF